MTARSRWPYPASKVYPAKTSSSQPLSVMTSHFQSHSDMASNAYVSHIQLQIWPPMSIHITIPSHAQPSNHVKTASQQIQTVQVICSASHQVFSYDAMFCSARYRVMASQILPHRSPGLTSNAYWFNFFPLGPYSDFPFGSLDS